MRCYLARRESADVVRVFRRCRELLSVVMGVTPSEATETLYRQVLAAPPPLRIPLKVTDDSGGK